MRRQGPPTSSSASWPLSTVAIRSPPNRLFRPTYRASPPELSTKEVFPFNPVLAVQDSYPADPIFILCRAFPGHSSELRSGPRELGRIGHGKRADLGSLTRMRQPRSTIWIERALMLLFLASLAGALNLVMAVHRRAAMDKCGEQTVTQRLPLDPLPTNVHFNDQKPLSVATTVITPAPSPPQPRSVTPEDPTKKALAELAASTIQEVEAARQADRKTASLEQARQSAIAESERAGDDAKCWSSSKYPPWPTEPGGLISKSIRWPPSATPWHVSVMCSRRPLPAPSRAKVHTRCSLIRGPMEAGGGRSSWNAPTEQSPCGPRGRRSRCSICRRSSIPARARSFWP